MRLLSFVVLGLALVLAACGSRSAAGPAWPKAAASEDDGGESLAPRSTAVAAADKPDAEVEADPDDAEATPAEPTEASADADSATEPADDLVITVEEEVINLDDIVIEIEDE